MTMEDSPAAALDEGRHNAFQVGYGLAPPGRMLLYQEAMGLSIRGYEGRWAPAAVLFTARWRPRQAGAAPGPAWSWAATAALRAM